MLSRTADSLFWSARYLERADFLARILGSALRLSSMPAAYGGENLWDSVIASAGAARAFQAVHPAATERTVRDFLAFDASNPSSIYSCLATARANGRAIGGTADGYIDRPKGMIALKGSLVPAYGLNSVLGNIPLLGDVLVSKKGEGIFGVTYSATGNAEQPDISVNPLAVLTPGILRRLFEGRMPNAANAPSNVQNNTQAAQGAPSPR